jgi:hypothetical protein
MKHIRTFSLALLLGSYSGAWALEVVCIDAVERQRISETYAELLAKYGLHAVAQEFLDASADTQDLREEISVCQQKHDEPALKLCENLAKQYEIKRSQRDAMIARFNVAMGLQDYLFTLKMKLERPLCEK